MRAILFFILLALSQVTQAQQPKSQVREQLRQQLHCGGTEPFWDLKIRDEGIFLTYYGQPKPIELRATLPSVIAGTSIQFAEVYKTHVADKSIRDSRHTIIIRKNVKCSDGMSDTIYPTEVYVLPEHGVPLYGCCKSQSE